MQSFSFAKKIPLQYDFTYLQQTFSGNKEIIATIIGLFLEDAAQFEKKSVEFIQTNQLDALKGASHKIKSSLKVVGALSLAEICAEIEDMCENKTDVELIKPLLLDLNTQLPKLREVIEAELKML